VFRAPICALGSGSLLLLLVKRNDCKSASIDEVQDDSIAVQIVVDSS
jgi:hypothetical protein